MKKILDVIKAFIIAFPGIIVLITFCILGWLITCGIIKIITLCFSLNFSWLIATGIWFALILLHSYFN